MADISKEELRVLARQLLVSENYLEEIDDKLEQGDTQAVRIWLLGTLDAKADRGVLPAHVATEFFRRLGFTSEEASGFRQYSAQRKLQEGQDLPKKLS